MPSPWLDAGLIAYTSFNAFLGRETLAAIASGAPDFVLTRHVGEAMVFKGVLEWEAFLDRLECENYAMFQRFMRVTWQLAVLRMSVDYEAWITREDDPPVARLNGVLAGHGAIAADH